MVVLAVHKSGATVLAESPYPAGPAIGAADGYLCNSELHSMVRVAAMREDANR